MAIRNDVAYGATKVSMVGLTKSLAVDEAKHGVTASAVVSPDSKGLTKH